MIRKWIKAIVFFLLGIGLMVGQSALGIFCIDRAAKGNDYWISLAPVAAVMMIAGVFLMIYSVYIVLKIIDIPKEKTKCVT